MGILVNFNYEKETFTTIIEHHTYLGNVLKQLGCNTKLCDFRNKCQIG